MSSQPEFSTPNSTASPPGGLPDPSSRIRSSAGLYRSARIRSVFVRKGVCAVLLTVLILLTGCDYTSAPADLLQAPAMAPDKQQLAEAVAAALPAHSKLTLPYADDRLEAIRRIDLDGDGVEEAIVTYLNEFSTPELLIMKQSNNGSGWTAWAVINEPLVTGLIWLRIADLDDDGRKEILVGWSRSTGEAKLLAVYRLDEGQLSRDNEGIPVLQSVSGLDYAAAAVGDADGDGFVETAVVTENANTQEQLLTVYKYRGGKLQPVSRLPLFNGVNGYHRLAVGKVAPDRYGIVAEGSVGAHSWYTSLIGWKDGRLVQIYPAPREWETAFNPYGVRSSDRNGDGIIELQRLKAAPGQNASMAETYFISEWLQWTGDEDQPFQLVAEEYTDYNYGFSIRIPNRWHNSYTISRPAETQPYGLASFDYHNPETGAQATWWTLYAIPGENYADIEEEWQQNSRHYLFLREAGGIVYAALFAGEPPEHWSDEEKEAYRALIPDKEQLRSMFRLELAEQ